MAKYGKFPERLVFSLWRRRFFISFLLLTVACPTARTSDARDGPPNVILILVDDLGWRDTAITGSHYYETPNIDGIAQRGVRFTQAYAASHLCSPSRAAILTGRYPTRTGVTHVITETGTSSSDENVYVDVGHPLLSVRRPNYLPLTEVTLPQRLRTVGYVSGIVGKWHLGGPGHLPEDFGFDHNAGGSSWGRPPSYFDPYISEYLKGNIGFAPRRQGEYLLDRETDEVLTFIEHARDQPFFLYWSTYAVHQPLEAKPEMIARFRQKPGAPGQDNAVYAAMLAHLDEAVGRLFSALGTMDLTRNTVVILTSDNGGQNSISSTAPLRGGKGDGYEGGLRVPLFIFWPGITKPGDVFDTVTNGVDLFSTILDIAGATPTENKIIDGLSLVPTLNHTGVLSRDAIFGHFPHYQLTGDPNKDTPPYAVIRSGNWKLIHYFEGKSELYDLDRDVGETNNLLLAEPARARALEDRLEQWLNETGAVRPINNPNFSAKANEKIVPGHLEQDFDSHSQ